MEIIVETFYAKGEKSGTSVRVRPLPNQGFDIEMRVECSKSMRTSFPVGQLFCLNVRRMSREGSPDFLYSNFRDPWRPVSPDFAKEFIKRSFG